ncbi:MAG: hypothetical protein Q7S33_04650 [Nanoarchaeota archaeon]|nr:hypothetical protein [Nanoarchaeota archaeon]
MKNKVLGNSIVVFLVLIIFLAFISIYSLNGNFESGLNNLERLNTITGNVITGMVVSDSPLIPEDKIFPVANSIFYVYANDSDGKADVRINCSLSDTVPLKVMNISLHNDAGNFVDFYVQNYPAGQIQSNVSSIRILSPNNYYIIVYATNINDKTSRSITRMISVKSDSVPQITNLYPIDNAKIYSANPTQSIVIYFNHSATDDFGIKKINFSIYNKSDNKLVSEYSYGSVGSLKEINDNFFRKLFVGNYTWIVYAIDSAGQSSVLISRDLEVLSTQSLSALSAPSSELISPAADYLVKINNDNVQTNIGFNYSVADDYKLNITNLLVYNSAGTLIINKSSPASGTKAYFNFTFNFSKGDYYWKVYAKDNSSKESVSGPRNFYIRLATDSSTDSPSITKKSPSDGAKVALNKDSEIKFSFSTSDSDGLSKIGVIVYDSKGESIEQSEFSQTTGTTDSVSTYLFLTAGKYQWKAYAKDINGKETYSSFVDLEVTPYISGGPTSSNKCSDGTSIYLCSSTKPKYCDSDLTLINKCSSCGCESGYECQTNEGCILTLNGSSGALENEKLWWIILISLISVIVIIAVIVVIIRVKNYYDY